MLGRTRVLAALAVGCAFGSAATGCAFAWMGVAHAAGHETHECNLTAAKAEPVSFTMPDMDDDTLAALDVVTVTECSDGSAHVAHAVPPVKGGAVGASCPGVSPVDICHANPDSQVHVTRRAITFIP